MSTEDIAQDVELRQWELINLNRGPGPERYQPADPGYGPAYCEQCEDDMPVERREWGFTLCVACKSATEAKRR